MAEAETKHGSISLHAHGDGTFHTHSPARSGDGESYMPLGEKSPGRVDHKSIGAALMHIAKNHAPDDHLHVEGHSDGFTTHHVREGGRVQGPHDHKNLRELKAHLVKFFDEEDEEN